MTPIDPAELGRTLFEESGDALFLFDPETEQLLDINPTALQLCGFPRAELLRLPVTYLFRSEDQGGQRRLRYASQHTGIFHSQEGFLLRHRADGVWVPVNLTVARLHTPGKTLALLTARDVSERRKAQALLETKEAELRRTIASVSDNLWSAEIDAEGRWAFRYISPVIERITGRSPQFYFGGPDRWLSGVHPEDRARVVEIVTGLAGGQSFRDEEYRIVRPDGAVRWVRDSVVAQRSPDGRSLRLDGILSDVTERRRSEALTAAEKGILERITTRAPLAGTLEELCRRLEEQAEGMLCSVLLMEEDGRHLRMVAGPSLPAAYAAAVGRLAVGPCAASCGTAAHRRERVVVEDIAADPLWAEFRERALPHGLRACWAMPVFSSCGQVLGTFAMYYREPRGPSPRELHLLDRATHLAGIAVERSQAEAAQRQAEERLRRLLEHAADLVTVIDAEGRIREESPSVERVLGYRDGERLGRPAVEFLHPDEQAQAQARFADLLGRPGGMSSATYRVRSADGTWRFLEAVGHNLLHDPLIQGVVVTSRDVTVRRLAEERVRSSEAKYRSLIENLEQCIFLKDADLRFVAVNRPFCQSLDRPEAAILGKTDFDFYPAHLAEKYRADDRAVLAEGRRLELEEQNLTGDRLRTVRVVKTPVKDGEGRAVGILGIFWDVTEQRALEAQLRQAQKMEALGQLAGGVAHDFNNLLTVILGNVSLIVSSLPPGDSNRPLAQAAENAAVRAAAVTRQMLGFARRMDLRTQPVNLNVVLDEVTGLLRSGLDPRIRLEVEKAPDLGPVQADPGQMNQVLMNLALNARDALPEGGCIRIETADVTLGEDYARRHLDARPGEFVRLRVSDTGHGIPAEVLPRIFDPFFTTKEPGKGTGLGLAVVFGIVKSHQGWIDCASAVGRGTSFDVYLPRAAAGPAADRLTAGRTPEGRGETVLLVDDESMLRDLGRSVLQRYGYRVLLAEDGARAVEVYRREQARIELVVLDLTMPGLSGREAYRQMLQVNPAAPVLFASGYAVEHALQTERDRGLGFLSKPYRPEELALAVRAALDRAHTPPAGPTVPVPAPPS